MRFSVDHINTQRQKQYRIFSFLLLLFCLLNHVASAHVIVEDLENMKGRDAAFLYLRLGYQHILPLGFDHILFIVSLFLPNPKLRPILLQATAFTVAHTITLGLAMYHVIKPPVRIVEPLIAASIMYVAIENIYLTKLRASRIGIVFLFGLIHGMGFASALSGLGLPKNAYLTSLLMFNIGVELGQISVILAVFFLVAKWFRDKPYYKSRIVIPLSVIIALISGFWLIQRLFFR